MAGMRSRSSTRHRGHLRTRLSVAVVAAALLAALYIYLDYQFRLCVVSGDEPEVASDRSALRALLAGSAKIPQLRAAGRIFRVKQGTRCQMDESDNKLPCRRLRDFPVQVKLIEGSHRGEKAWFCFEDIRWPLHAP